MERLYPVVCLIFGIIVCKAGFKKKKLSLVDCIDTHRWITARDLTLSKNKHSNKDDSDIQRG